MPGLPVCLSAEENTAKLGMVVRTAPDRRYNCGSESRMDSFKEIDKPERRVRLLAGGAGERFRNE